MIFAILKNRHQLRFGFEVRAAKEVIINDNFISFLDQQVFSDSKMSNLLTEIFFSEMKSSLLAPQLSKSFRFCSK